MKLSIGLPLQLLVSLRQDGCHSQLTFSNTTQSCLDIELKFGVSESLKHQNIACDSAYCHFQPCHLTTKDERLKLW